jgi:hypothetical protein
MPRAPADWPPVPPSVDPLSLAVDRRRAWLAIGLVAGTVVLYQIAVTRLLSVVLWYHWAFLAVSMAMLGLGAPGVWFALSRPGPRALARCLWAAAIALPGSVLLILHHSDLTGRPAVLVCMAALLVPMLLLGAAVCALLLAAPGPEVGRMYGADLLGAATAALVVVPLMWLVDTPRLLAALGLLPIAAVWLLAPGRGRAALPAGAALLALCFVPAPFELTRTKTYDEAPFQEAVLLVKWTPTARLAFFNVPLWHDPRSDYGWGLGTKAPKQSVKQYWMEQDGSAGTPVTRFDGDLTKLQHLLFDATAAAYQLERPRRVAVIGAGGGRDVLSALLVGSEHVDAVELNPAVIATIGGELREFSGDIYRHPGVQAHAAEGRSFLTRSSGDYDVIQISMIDSWAATAAGAFALAENNLYTVEAYQLYWQRLSERGLVTTSRWHGNFESLRLLGIHFAALRGLGVPNPEDHLAVVSGGLIDTLIASRQPFAGARLERLREVCAERGFELAYPSPALSKDYADFLANGSAPQPIVDLSPSTDDRPFFFQILPPFSLFDAETARKISTNAEAVHTLQLLVVAVTGVALLLFFAPFLVRPLRTSRTGFWRGSMFFALIGVGFMLLEMPWLQRFVLFLGHPSHAAAVVLGSLLAGTGLGASCAARIGLPRVQTFGLFVPALLVAVHLATPALFAAGLGADLGVRIALSLGLLLPAGFALGLMFPSGMARFGDANKAWYWSVNGACGVFASVSSLALAMQFGFTAVGFAGVACYVGAVLLLRGARAA